MVSRIVGAVLIAAAAVVPMQPAAARNAALRGAIIGAIVGATTGAAIASEGRRYRNDYYDWHDECYHRRHDGRFAHARPRHCR